MKIHEIPNAKKAQIMGYLPDSKEYSKFMKLLERASKWVSEIKYLGDFKIKKEIPIITLKCNASSTTQSKKVLERLIDCGSLTGLGIFFALEYLREFFVEPSLYRNITSPLTSDERNSSNIRKSLERKLEGIFKNGFDKPLSTPIWMGYDYLKALEYKEDEWPKLMAVYSREKLEHVEGVEGGEGYVWKFKTRPKEALKYIVWLENLNK